MAFNKKQYWENRNKGLRGQGEITRTELPFNDKKYVRLHPSGMIVKKETIAKGKLYVNGRKISEETK